MCVKILLPKKRQLEIMRLFEIILILMLIIFLLRLISTPTNKYLWLFILLVSTVAFLQMLMEGIRWQMVPSYFLILFVLVFPRIQNKFFRIIHSLIACVTLIIAIFLPAFFPVFNFEKPSGKYKIGTKTYYFTDSSRNELFADNLKRKREILIQIWYPTDEKPNNDFTPYLENSTIKINAIADQFGYPKICFSQLKYIKSNAISNVEISHIKEKFPVLIYLTGLNGSRQFSSFQIQELVSQGYIVAGIDNPGAVGVVPYPDGRSITGLPIEKIKALVDQSIEDLPTIPTLNNIKMKDGIIPYFSDDVSFVISCLGQMNSYDLQNILTNHIDLTKIGVFGVSLGGIVAADASVKDKRIRACLIMESPISKNVIDKGIQIPTMIITRNAETMRLERKKSGGWNEKEIEIHQYGMKTIYDRLPSNGYFIKIPKMFHVDFLDIPLWFPFGSYIGLTGKMKTKHAHQIINNFSVAFFDKELMGVSSGFLKYADEIYPEIEYWSK